MKKVILLFAMSAMMLLSGCRIMKVATPMLAEHKQYDIPIQGVGERIPDNAVLLGSVFAGDKGFTVSCSYDKIIHEVVVMAKDMGGDLIVITRHEEPNPRSSCHQVWANVYKTK